MKPRDELGMTSASYVLATGLSLIILTWCTLFIVASYSRAVIRYSSEQAVRSASANYSINQSSEQARQKCLEEFQNNLILGVSDEQVEKLNVTCTVSNSNVRLNVEGTLPNLGNRFTPMRVNETTNRKLERP